jgi:hypothetical protein
VLWGIQYIVCMCIIIDITDIINDCMGTSRVFGGGWAAIIVPMMVGSGNICAYMRREQ